MDETMATLKIFAAAALCAALAGCGASDSANDTKPSASARDGGELLLVVTGEAPPYVSYNEATCDFVGIEVDIARSAASKLGKKLAIRREKFENLLPMVKAGEADMAASGITITEGRLKDVDFTDTVATEGGLFLYRAGEKEPSMVTAEALRVGVVDSTTHDFYLTYHNIDPIRYRFCTDAVRDLLTGKLDTVFYDKNTLEDSAAKSGGRLLVTALETRENFGIVVGKGATALKNALNEAIAERRAK
jgi:polar amino acid transport system substrate-binding protein